MVHLSHFIDSSHHLEVISGVEDFQKKIVSVFAELFEDFLRACDALREPFGGRQNVLEGAEVSTDGMWQNSQNAFGDRRRFSFVVHLVISGRCVLLLMLHDRHQQLNRQRSRNVGNCGPGHGALLIQSSILGGLKRK